MSKGRRLTSRELIEYRHSYHCFLAQNLPAYLPPPSTVAPPPPPPRPSAKGVASGDVDLKLLDLDPHNWKKQDHYLLLGLQDKRHLATASDIKSAYRRRVLLYHPDKLQQASAFSPEPKAAAGAGPEQKEDAIFKCIFHAYQLLSDPEKRRQYDSVDKGSFDDSIPAENAVPPGDVEAFLAVYRHVFIANARFSRKQPVPDIGHAHSPREEVEAFYFFWSTFESWRAFEYLDEDESEHPENRADKRWLEKKNKATRMKRKNEDNARLRRLFEQAYKIDPRMVRFREDDRLRKDAIRLEKEMAALKIVQEKERLRAERERHETEERERAAQAKAAITKVKDLAQAESRREKKAFKKVLVDNLYFVTNLTDIKMINERSILTEKLLLRVTDLQSLQGELEGRIADGRTADIFDWLLETYNQLDPALAPKAAPEQPAAKTPEQPVAENGTQSPWTLDETDTLINAVKMHPGGLRDRWVKITEWYNRHVSHLDKRLAERSTEELIKRAGEIKQTTEDGQAAAAVPTEAQVDYKALQKKRDPRIDQAAPTVTFEEDEQQPQQSAWTAEEQKNLQQALKLSKADDPARWDKISEAVGRPKKDCMLRAKEIAQLLKQKKQ